MTKRLEEAFATAAMLPEQEQDNFAEFLLAELQDEGEWQTSFASRPDVLTQLANEARDERRNGLTKPIEDLLK